MKHILMRAHMSPFYNPGYLEALLNDFMGSNIGNLVFSHSVTRTLMLPDTQIEFDRCCTFDDEKIEYIEQTYDALVIPLANALRKSFIPNLEIMAEAIRRLDIPCIVIGIGYQAGIKDKYSYKHKWNDTVKEFADAVLEKSSLIGVRGEITARYLEHLGYERERHFTVIGCPSMYMYGAELPRPKQIDPTGPLRVNLNGKSQLGADAYRVIERAARDAAEYYYIPQNTPELTMMFTGLPLKTLDPELVVNDPWPQDLAHPFYAGGHGRGFVNVESWRRFLAKGDLNFGTRIHGNIMGVLAGVPAFIAAPDIRVLELAEYHNIAHAPIGDIDMSGGLAGLLEGVDFGRVLDGHEQRFSHYLDFLHANGLETIYDEPLGNVPFDEKLAKVKFPGPIKPINKDLNPKHRLQSKRVLDALKKKGKA